jgi:predicted Ser/Thr protein kinase
MIGQVLPRLRLVPSVLRTTTKTFEESKRRFKNLKRLGAGAFGEAFSAKMNGKAVIIKTAAGTPGLVSKMTAAHTMAHEVRVLAKIQKFPFVPRLIEVGRDFFVLEDVKGDSMLNLLDGKGLEPREILAVVVSAGTMATMLHREGIAHNDFEPRNILLTPNGVVIIDFGIAVIKGKKSSIEKIISMPTFSGAMEKDLLSLVSMASLAASGKVPQNVRVMILSTIEKFQKRALGGKVTPETAGDFARDLLLALGQLGALAVRDGKIRRERVRVVAV